MDEFCGRIFVRDSSDVLLDNRTCIEFGGDVVACCADKFYAAFVGLVVGLGADESRKERVVDVDDAVGIARNEVFREHLHISSQDDEVDVVAFEQFEFFGFLFGFVVFSDGYNFERNVELFAYNREVGVVADDKRNFDVPFAGGVACQQVVDAVRHLRDEDSHALNAFGKADVERHVVALGVERVEVVADFLFGDDKVVEFPLDAHIENPVVAVDVLVEIYDVAAVFVDETGDNGNDARLVGTVHSQNCCVVFVVVHFFEFFCKDSDFLPIYGMKTANGCNL